MPHYDFTCDTCTARHELHRQMSQASDPAPCPDCGAEMARVWDGEAVTMTHDLRDSWCDGYEVFQLPPNHPDRIVTSETQLKRVYERNGMDETGRPLC